MEKLRGCPLEILDLSTNHFEHKSKTVPTVGFPSLSEPKTSNPAEVQRKQVLQEKKGATKSTTYSTNINIHKSV